MYLGKNIRYLRKKKNWSQEYLANKLGYKSFTTVQKWEVGTAEPQFKKAHELAELFGVALDDMINKDLEKDETSKFDNNIDINSAVPLTRKIPIVGKIAAGQPIEAIENIIGYTYIEESLKGEFIALKIDGDSMSPTIPCDSTVLIRLQEDAESGEIVAAYINGYDATCKRLRKLESGGLMLISLNPKYEPMAFTAQEVRELPVKIIGKVIEVRTKL